MALRCLGLCALSHDTFLNTSYFVISCHEPTKYNLQSEKEKEEDEEEEEEEEEEDEEEGITPTPRATKHNKKQQHGTATHS